MSLHHAMACWPARGPLPWRIGPLPEWIEQSLIQARQEECAAWDERVLNAQHLNEVFALGRACVGYGVQAALLLTTRSAGTINVNDIAAQRSTRTQQAG